MGKALQDFGGRLSGRGRAVSLCLLVVAVNVTGAWLLHSFANLTRVEWRAALVLAALSTILVAAPHIAFLTIVWFSRYNEFRNSLKDLALEAYLKRFWSDRLETHQLASASKNPKGGEVCQEVFDSIYHEQYGLIPFTIPFVILVLNAYVAAALVASLWTCVSGLTPYAPCQKVVFGADATLLVSSMAGALMFVVSDSVFAIRRKSLNVADVYWYALRIFLAIPIAITIANTPGSKETHAVLAFALGTLPVDVLIGVIRRFGFPQLQKDDQQEDSDKLLLLSGVTLPIVSTLAAEGINSIEQVATVDPVLLAIRTGFPFRFTLRLGSQAIVRRHFGEGAANLQPIGLGDVVPIYLLIKALDARTGTGPDIAAPNPAAPNPAGPDPSACTNYPKIDDPELVIESAAARLLSTDPPEVRTAIVKMKFRQIAAEEYTLMLARITPLDPSL